MTENAEQDESKLKIAGIEARTAIIVAFVGAMASIATVVVTKTLDRERLSRAEWEQLAPKQNWLRIRGIDGPADTRVRIVAKINGISYAYPTETAWVVLGGRLTEGRFPLALGGPPYRVSFSLEARGADGGLYLSQRIDEVDVSANERRYSLLPVKMGDAGWSGGSSRGVAIGPSIEIRYAITSD